MRIAKRWLAVGTVALVGLWSCRQAGPDDVAEGATAEPADEGESPGEVRLSSEALSAIGLRTAAVERRGVGGLIHATAVLKPNADRLAHVAPRIPGRVAQSLITLGQRVRAGERLLVLDSVELGEAKSAFRKARARMEVAQSSYEREKRLYEDGRITSEREMLEARGAYLEAKAEFEAAEERLHLYGLSQQAVEQLRPEHDADASLLAVTAPISGTVVGKHMTLGEVVGPEDVTCTIADLSTLWLVLSIYEKDVPRVHPGQQVEVEVDAYPGQGFPGTLTYVGDVLDEETRTVEARVEIDNAAGTLKPGMFARAALQTEALAEAVTVPAQAVQREGDRQVVFVALDDTSFAVRPVQVGRAFNGWVEIVGGLKLGERVAAEGSFALKSERAKDTFGEE
ncbi:MAG: efflux RND transporter periplasmic adaptor subunit [Candidatus Latescibacterota bacterium]